MWQITANLVKLRLERKQAEEMVAQREQAE